jgi:hypothetical protein
MAWADKLPQMQADRAAWLAEHGPRLRERDARQREERERATRVLRDALAAANVSDKDRSLIFRMSGLAA